VGVKKRGKASLWERGEMVTRPMWALDFELTNEVAKDGRCNSKKAGGSSGGRYLFDCEGTRTVVRLCEDDAQRKIRSTLSKKVGENREAVKNKEERWWANRFCRRTGELKGGGEKKS